MKKNNSPNTDFLECVPKRVEGIEYSKDSDGNVVLKMKNTGLFNRIAQIVLKKPEISYIHLDEIGSCVWLLSDGEKTVTELGESVEKRFGEKVHPLYGRLSQYLRTLESYGFIRYS